MNVHEISNTGEFHGKIVKATQILVKIRQKQDRKSLQSETHLVHACNRSYHTDICSAGNQSNFTKHSNCGVCNQSSHKHKVLVIFVKF
jgi:hypothetical protein